MCFTFEEFWESYMKEIDVEKNGLNCDCKGIKEYCRQFYEEGKTVEKIKANIIIPFLKKEIMHKASYKQVMKRQYRELKQELSNQREINSETVSSWAKKYADLLKINAILKEILVMAMDKGDLCSICQDLGEDLPHCNIQHNPDCVEHMINLMARSREREEQ